MAVTSIKEFHNRRRSGIDENGKPTHTRAFLVTTDDRQDGTAVALTAELPASPGPAARVPRHRDPHPKGDGSSVQTLTAEPHENSDVHFVVTAEYGVPTNETTSTTADPLAAAAEISYGAGESTESYMYDRSPQPSDWNLLIDGPWKGKPVTNTAGDRFEDSQERESSELVITIATNEPTYNANDMERYSHTLNESAVTIDGTTYAAGTLKLSPITATRVRENGQTYYKVTKTLKARRDGWDYEPFDQGTNQLDYKTPEPPPRRDKCGRVPILDAARLKVATAWPLNGKGKAKKNPTDMPAVLKFRPYEHKGWSSLKWE